MRLGGLQGVLQRFALGLVFVDELLAARRLRLLPGGPFSCQVGGWLLRLPLGPFRLVVGSELLTLRLGRLQSVLQRFALGFVFVDQLLAARRLGLLPGGPFSCQVGG